MISAAVRVRWRFDVAFLDAGTRSCRGAWRCTFELAASFEALATESRL